MMSMILKAAVKSMDKDYKNNGNVKWIFTKFPIDREGNIAARFELTTPMEDVTAALEKLL